MITYNHEKFIAEAIYGVLMQEVDFEVELIIADDCSTDRTGEIVKTFIDSHPKGHWIKYTRHKKNLGMMPNFIWALESCQGKYIAFCEGDDYWIDSNKLFNQVFFLINNPNFSFSFHDAYYLYNGIKEKTFSDKYTFLNRGSKVFSIKDLEKYKWFIPSCSLVFRNFKIPNWLSKSSIGDFSIHLILSEIGDFYFHDSIWGVYRIHENGISQRINTFSNRLNDISLWFTNIKGIRKVILFRWYFSVLWRFLKSKILNE
ncbi:glycosyltransferase [Algoriphagus sp. oki45]|nr:glycosyltransferase [Algoriphagus sp. oki45]